MFLLSIITNIKLFKNKKHFFIHSNSKNHNTGITSDKGSKYNIISKNSINTFKTGININKGVKTNIASKTRYLIIMLA